MTASRLFIFTAIIEPYGIKYINDYKVTQSCCESPHARKDENDERARSISVLVSAKTHQQRNL